MLCFLVAIKYGQMVTKLFHIQMKSSSESYRIRYDVIKQSIQS
jgi:hypothetical protein